jgi:phosphoribosyl 1,2-cyclic phosphodiesterase
MRASKPLKIALLGVRGSRPVHRDDSTKFGGHTTCIELVTPENFSAFIDGGTGLIRRSREVKNHCHEHHMLVTHTHWDHVLGYRYFEPLFHKDHTVTFYAASTQRTTFERLFDKIIPVSVKAKVKVVEINPEETFTINGSLRVSTFQLNHPGVTLAYKIHYEASSCVIVTDTAPLLPGNLLGDRMPAAKQEVFIANYQENFRSFVHNVHTVVYDSHFTPQTLKPDWGHSTPDLAVDAIDGSNAKRLILFHHAPEDTDADVRSKVAALPKLSKCEIVAAQEGDQWLIS